MTEGKRRLSNLLRDWLVFCLYRRRNFWNISVSRCQRIENRTCCYSHTGDETIKNFFAEKGRKKFKCGLASVVGSFVSTRFLILQQLFRENETLTKGAEIRHRAQQTPARGFAAREYGIARRQNRQLRRVFSDITRQTYLIFNTWSRVMRVCRPLAGLVWYVCIYCVQNSGNSDFYNENFTWEILPRYTCYMYM